MEVEEQQVRITVSGHRYDFRFARGLNAELHLVTLSALQGAKPVDGAFFELTQSDGVVNRLATAFGEPHVTAAVAGPLRVRVIPPLGWRLSAGQTNPSTYMVVSDIQLKVVIQLEPVSR